MRLALGLLCLMCMMLVLPACSSNSSQASSDAGDGAARPTAEGGPANPPPESGAEDAGQDGPGDSGTVCNALANSASPVTIQQVATDPPAAEGGTVVEGTYELTSEVRYTGPGGATGPAGTDRTTIQIQLGVIQVAKATDPPTSTYTLSTSGTTYVSSGVCPPSLGGLMGSYTATATTFVASLAAAGGDGGAPWTVDTFTMQQ